MKRPVLIALLAGIILIIGNVFIFNNLFNKQVNYQKNILFSQAGLSTSNIEQVVMRFESDLNYILFSDDISELFGEVSANSQSLRKLELFYSSYNSLIKNIDIYDNNKNVFNLFKDKKFISDQYIAQRQRKLVHKEQVKIQKDEYQYYIPVFSGDEVYGNIVVSVNLSEYLIEELNKFFLDEISYQWVIDPGTKVFQTNFPGQNVTVEGYEFMLEDIKLDRENLLRHKVSSDSLSTRMITVYKSLSVLDHKFGIAFSFNNTYFVEQIFTQIIVVSVISFLLFLITVFLLLTQFSGVLKKKRLIETEIIQLKEILLNLPIGVIIFNKSGKINYINHLARDMFLIKENELVTGNTITEKFLSASGRLKSKSKTAAFDSNQFVLYEREGNEVILYRKEFPYYIGEEEFIMSAFTDITAIEKSRKYEAASNTAKSEFLAKMSHEIRTPMNGIIGMTDAINQDNLTKDQIEYIDIVKRSADLLLNIIDDILDYSKIEAGKMQLEDLPYKLSEEVKLSLDLFRAIVEEKGLKLSTKIGEDVPDDIIGDPFRLRQVLSNLISNAVKFTHEGELRLEVKLDERYDGNLTLLFEVSDTGVGIPRERIDSIFNTFTQADHSTSRKYGGSGLGTTISKQLVNLMNGEIWAESPSGISQDKKRPGSKFSFTIEVFSNEEIKKDLDYSTYTSFSETKGYVLGKNPSALQRVTGFLKHLGMQVDVHTFKEDEDLISVIQDEIGSHNYHVIFIMDGPKLDGFWVTRQLFNAGLNDMYRIIMISSKHKQENYVQSKVAKVDFYLVQPFEQNLLKQYLLHWFPGIKDIVIHEEAKLQKGLKILVAEDNLINQKVAQTIFANLGYTIDIAIDGKEVVDMVKIKNYDVVFMDLQMPEKDGVDATVEIRGLGFQMPIIAMTATASKVGRDSAITSGMNDYITKPVRVVAVKSVLEKWFS